MHRQFRAALAEAQGTSQFVIVVVADIRDFSRFSLTRESPDVAMYIRRVYVRMIDEYFPDASFFKPTGDGLLLTVPYTDKTLVAVASATVDASLRCHSDFASLCKDDPMVNFPVPGAVGFGVARGTACCLKSGETVLDYSGHLLNLTSRLMDLARPSGVVIDGAFGLNLLDEGIRARFDSVKAYIRSVAEDAPKEVYFLKGYVQIPDSAKQPLRAQQWITQQETKTASEWRALTSEAGHWRFALSSEPRSVELIKVVLQYPNPRKKGTSFYVTFKAFEYLPDAGVPYVLLMLKELAGHLRTVKIRGNVPVVARISYV